MLTGANEMDRQSKQNHSLLTPKKYDVLFLWFSQKYW